MTVPCPMFQEWGYCRHGTDYSIRNPKQLAAA
jgi:hypothetical protein